jgi:hypothetical protein
MGESLQEFLSRHRAGHEPFLLSEDASMYL